MWDKTVSFSLHKIMVKCLDWLSHTMLKKKLVKQ